MSLVGANYSDIRSSLVTYLKSKPDFKDYNFEGSVINSLIDILAFNAYQNAFNLNMIGNEMFLDTALLKESVVSKAKLLGYTPKSKKSSRADIQIIVYPDDDPTQLLIPKNSKFYSTIDNILYYFYTLEEVIVSPDSSGNFITDLTIFEGSPVTYTFTVSDTTQKFVIADENVDTSLIKVYVRENTISSDKAEYVLSETLANIKASSKVYFIEMNNEGKYEIYFGNDVIGKSVSLNSEVTIETIICRGNTPNNISSFLPKDYVVFNKDVPSKYYGNIFITTLTASTDGEDEDDIEDIRFSAPKKYNMQNRVVTEEDYKNWILSQYNDIESISVWGGEKNTPPLYGKTVIAIKPKYGYYLSNIRKADLIYNVSKKSVMSIDPVIVDPTITFIKMTNNIRYDSRKTTETVNGILTSVQNIISSYETDILGKFENGFFTAPIINSIENINSSILDNTAEILLEKRLTPILNSNMTYELSFSGSLYIPYSGYLGCLSSTAFKADQYGNNEIYLDDDGLGNVRVYTYVKNEKKYLNNSQGTIDYTNGIIKINSLKVTDIVDSSVNYLRIFVVPEEKYYVPTKNEILLLSDTSIKLYDLGNKSYIRNISFTTSSNNGVLYSNYITGSVI